MTFTHVGSVLTWDTGSSQTGYTPNGVGNLVVVIQLTKLANSPVFSNISSSNVTWSKLVPDFVSSVASTPTGAAIWIGTVTSTSAATVSLTWGSPGTEPAHWEARVMEFSSTVGSWALDAHGTVDTNTTPAVNYASLTPAAAGELYVGAHYDDNGAVAGSTSGYTYSLSSHGNGALYNASCGSGAQQPAFGSGSRVMAGIMALIKEGSSSVTGTGAVTLKKMTAAASGTPKIYGTAVVTLKKMTVSGTGHAPLLGTGAVTLKKMTASVSGSVKITGTADVTLKKMTASVSGSVKITGTATVTLKKMTVSGTGPGGTVLQTLFGQPATGSTVSDDFTAYTMAMEFSLIQDAPLSGVWFYSPSGATTLPAGCAILNLDTSAVVSGTENDSPSWSGAAGSGWVRCAYDRSVTLATGTKYAVAIYKDTTEFVYSATAHYWDTTGDGASGLTSGIISAPNNAGSVHGQDSFFAGGSTFTVPDSSFNASNYWVDVEVVVVSSSVSGSGAVILKKMTSSGSGIVIVTGSGDVTLKKMTASGSGHAPLLGTGTVTLKKMIVSGSGSDKVIGVGAITMYKMVVHGTNIPIPKASSLFIFSLR